MSLVLSGSKPKGLEVKTYGFPIEARGQEVVRLGDYEISLVDFLCAAYYVLTNSDLNGLTDPRIEFVQAVKKMEIGPGGDYVVEGISIPTRKFNGDSLNQDWIK
ncbi:MAG: hypothetical protein PHF35_04305 [Candidatus Moranbacteria bacterium]|nr:hypothetical protein [Candidatus Moranbacteria bacterium]